MNKDKKSKTTIGKAIGGVIGLLLKFSMDLAIGISQSFSTMYDDKTDKKKKSVKKKQNGKSKKRK